MLTTNAFSLEPARFVKNPDAGQASVRHEADFERPCATCWSAYTRFYGDLKGVLGYEALHSSFGIGLELDTSKYDIIVTRARAVLRFKRGDNVEGYGLGLAVSF